MDDAPMGRADDLHLMVIQPEEAQHLALKKWKRGKSWPYLGSGDCSCHPWSIMIRLVWAGR